MSAAALLLIPIYALFIPDMSKDLALVLTGYFWGVIQGNGLDWYFLGKQNLQAYLTIDSVMRGQP